MADGAGIRLAALPDVSVAQVRLATRVPDGLAAWLVARTARSFRYAGPAWGSTLQSLRRGRPTEIEYLNGEVVRRGRDVGVPTPLNARERERTGGSFAPAELAALLPSAPRRH